MIKILINLDAVKKVEKWPSFYRVKIYPKGSTTPILCDKTAEEQATESVENYMSGRLSSHLNSLSGEELDSIFKS